MREVRSEGDLSSVPEQPSSVSMADRTLGLLALLARLIRAPVAYLQETQAGRILPMFVRS